MANGTSYTFFRYFAAGPDDRRWGMHVTSVGTSITRPGERYPQPVHPAPYDFDWSQGRALPGYHMVYISAGAGWYQWGKEQQRRVEGGDVMFVFENEWHRYAPDPSTGWEEHWVGFDGPRARELLDAGFFSAARHVVRARSNAEMLAAFQMLRASANAGAPGMQPTMSAQCEYALALAHASTLPVSVADTNSDQLVERVIRILTERVRTWVDMKALAEEVGVSYRSLRRAFAQYTGMGPHQYHVELRISLARRLLSDPSVSVKEAAFQTGYTDEHYFSRIFHQKMGMTPSDWKRRVRDQRAPAVGDPPANDDDAYSLGEAPGSVA